MFYRVIPPCTTCTILVSLLVLIFHSFLRGLTKKTESRTTKVPGSPQLEDHDGEVQRRSGQYLHEGDSGWLPIFSTDSRRPESSGSGVDEETSVKRSEEVGDGRGSVVVERFPYVRSGESDTVTHTRVGTLVGNRDGSG